MSEPETTSDAEALARFGFSEAWRQALAAADEPGLQPARVVLEHGRFYRIWDGHSELLAVAAGRLRHDADSAAEMPAVGDWVGFRLRQGKTHPGGGGDEALAQIRRVLPRTSKFSRRGSGVRVEEQIVAANIDTVFLMVGLDADFNVRRLERYLTVAHGSGARPIVLLNKADLAPAAAERRAEVAALAPGVTVVTLSLAEPRGHEPLLPLLEPRRTVALLGSSGVGKSTLLNRLVGSDVQRTGAVRAYDSRGRHTTTHAQLFALPGGALCIDTPGMRALSLWEVDEGLETAFDDVEAIAACCRFSDCRHEDEPGCAVRAALEAGALPRERYESFLKLHAEVKDLHKDPWTRRPRRQREKAANRSLKKVTREE